MEQNNTCNDEIDLFELFQKLYEQRWIILGITALTTALAVLVSIFMPKAYKAHRELDLAYSVYTNLSQKITSFYQEK